MRVRKMQSSGRLQDEEELVKKIRKNDDSLEEIASGIHARIDRNIDYLNINKLGEITKVNGNIDKNKYSLGANFYNLINQKING